MIYMFNSLGLTHYWIEKKNCEKYVMCPSGKLVTKLEWSPEDREVIQSKLKTKECFLDRTILQNNLDFHGYYWSIYDIGNSTCHDYSGRELTAKAQCESLLSDKDANMVTLHDICRNLQCETPHKNESYFAGPALNGTYCGMGKECCDRKCVPVTEPPHIFKYCQEDNWSNWKEDSCKSSCLEKSKGVVIKRRFCEHLGHRTANCTSQYYDMVVCEDYFVCSVERKTNVEFTTIKCIEFTHKAGKTKMQLGLRMSSGIQMFHNIEKPWIACTIFCRRLGPLGWYAPRQEMLDVGVDPYFPDGTWCHNDGGQDYYCRQHHCLPENYSFDVEFEHCC